MNSYLITRIEKYKNSPGSPVTKIEKHNERMKDTYKSNPDIDPNRSSQNYNLIKPVSSYKKEIRRILEQHPNIKVRKDSVVFQDAIVTASPEFLETLDCNKLQEFFRRALRFYLDRFGEDNFISAVVHMDEKTPHMHFCFVPVTADGRLSSKEVIGGPAGLRKLQDDFYNHMQKMYPELDRGLPSKDTNRTHLPVSMYKEVAEIDKTIQNITKTTRNIGLLDMKSGKADVVKQLSELTPQIAKMKTSLESNIEYVQRVEFRESEYKRQISELEESVHSLTRRIRDLEALKETVSRKLDEALDIIEVFKGFVQSVPTLIAQKIIFDPYSWKFFKPISELVPYPERTREREER